MSEERSVTLALSELKALMSETAREAEFTTIRHAAEPEVPPAGDAGQLWF